MVYGITKQATDFSAQNMNPWPVRLLKVLFFFVPRANPDIEPLYPQVRSWALELSEDGWPKREVGLDAEGNALFATPNDRNSGFWPDMALTQFNLEDLEPLEVDQFEKLWNQRR